MSLPRSLFVALALLAHCPRVEAARPFVTDDARVVDVGGCQIETFVKQQRNFGEREFWFLPACNPAGVEITAGGLNLRNDAAGRSSSTILQGKALLRPLQTNGYGVALTVGGLQQRPFVGSQPYYWSPYVNLVSSISVKDDRAVFHLNAGALDDRNTGVLRPTWGVGSEILVAPRLYAIVEAYGQKGEKTNQQIGLRFWVVPNRVQIDGTYGAQKSGPPTRTWTSLGLRLLF
jgi:hypothetical protein